MKQIGKTKLWHSITYLVASFDIIFWVARLRRSNPPELLPEPWP